MTLIPVLLMLSVYLGVGCAVAAGSWASVRSRHTDAFPLGASKILIVALHEVARWPLTLIGK